jgi:hypothetical protein
MFSIVGFAILTAVTVKSSVVWDTPPCNLVKAWTTQHCIPEDLLLLLYKTIVLSYWRTSDTFVLFVFRGILEKKPGGKSAAGA